MQKLREKDQDLETTIENRKQLEIELAEMGGQNSVLERILNKLMDDARSENS